MLAAINLVGWQLEMKWLESEPDESWGFFYGQRPTQPHQGYGLSLGAEEEPLRVRLYLVSCSCKCVLSLPLIINTFIQKGLELE